MSPEVIRRPSVAGFYYPSEAEALRAEIELRCASSHEKKPFKAVLVPHSPYQRCGDVSASVWARTAIPKRCILVGPSLTGSWMPWSMLTGGAYRTPLGDVPVDSSLAQAVLRRCPFIESDAWGQAGEHAVEVQLPFLQVLGPEALRCVPVLVGSPDLAQHQRLAEGLAEAIAAEKEPVLLAASSDLSHFEADAAVKLKDAAMLEAMRAVDAGRLQSVVEARSVQMEGFFAVNVVLQAARLLGSKRGECFAYATNAAAGGDPDSAVGYAGVGWL